MKPLFALLPAFLIFTAQTSLAADRVAKDTVSFVTSNVVLEDNPKAGQYNISLYSDDGQWKVQLNYHAEESMFGTFTNEDFGLPGDGRYYNYARNPKNDMVFWSFTDMVVTVSDEVTEYHISANCLASNDTRFLIEGSIPVLTPTDTVSSYLGYAQRTDNPFYGTYQFNAENEDYRLAYGIVGSDVVGTFYTADILMPELYDKQHETPIAVRSAIAQHRQVADTLWLTLDVMADDLTLYHLTMYNAKHEVPVMAEESIEIEGEIVLQDLTQMYGCYQLAAQNSEWGVGIAFVPDAFAEGRTEWGMEYIFMPYTTMIRLADNYVVRIHDVSVTLQVTDDGQMIFRAEILSTDGTLYHVTLKSPGPGYLGEPDEVVNLEMEHVAMLDYTETGIIGLGAYIPNQCQMRVYLNAFDLSGDYYTRDAVLDMCDVMVVRPADGTFVFHDARGVNSHFETDADGITHATIDMLGIDNVLYHATFDIPHLRCMDDCSYSLDDAVMIGVQEAVADETADGYGAFTLQFQHLPADDDAADLDVIYNGEIFTFGLKTQGTGIAGEYGYVVGSLTDDYGHQIFEQGIEVRMAAMAGKLNIAAVEPLKLDGYTTVLYDISFELAMRHGVVVEGSGRNFLLCIDPDGEMVEITEPELASLRQQLAEQGLQVRKVFRDGRMMIVSPIYNSNNNNQNNEEILYSVDGKRIVSLR